jgi:excisionase family DNA binding protein
MSNSDIEEMDRSLGVVEVAHRTGLAEPTIRALAAGGKLASFKIGRRRLFLQSEVQRFLAEYASRPSSED